MHPCKSRHLWNRCPRRNLRPEFAQLHPCHMGPMDGHVSDYELESIETQSTTILITAFAILFSAMAQARAGSDRLSSFHASIVLDLSWMNNTNTFIYFLLYVHHKSQPGPEQIKPDLGSWIRHLGGKLLVFGSLGSNSDEDQENQKMYLSLVERSTVPTGHIDGTSCR
ncbi:hypothetical protein B0H14DRAFT_95286 [Mycena olivaceomarginata]|nr:hypothetical protein B0H14DRAFT_95286 [Mycena olivaceomarginata]